MLKITLKNIEKIRLLDDEKLGLIKLYEQIKKDGYNLYLFGSRLKHWGADIDLLISPDPGLKKLIKYQAIFNKYTDTKLDLIPHNKENKPFISTLGFKHL